MEKSHKIDAHQHFWKYDSQKHAWIDDSMAVLKRDYLPEDLEPILKKNQIDGCVAVQADQSDAETRFLLELSRKHSFIKGVVGWVDLKAKDLEDQLGEYSKYSQIKGFRHVLQDEADPEFILGDDFFNGLGQLSKYGFTYDILVFPKQLDAAVKAVRKLPHQKFVLDHLAKPQIGRDDSGLWKKGIKDLAQNDNTYCKLSGMVTETKWKAWKYGDFVPYMDYILENFGSKRLMFGSDWPVCNLSGEYNEVLGIVNQYVTSLSETEQKAILGNNAIEFYQL
ncbi:amidohydrolase family protein [Belliella marina]|uniref:Amidohydrolase family protein n=1 Tax=Belliella marina TaxID=1644146 RepID=A0ABW4VFH1_9BACT